MAEPKSENAIPALLGIGSFFALAVGVGLWLAMMHQRPNDSYVETVLAGAGGGFFAAYFLFFVFFKSIEVINRLRRRRRP